MTIHDYIEKHGLKLMRNYRLFNNDDASAPAVLIDFSEGVEARLQEGIDDQYEFYSSADETHVVSINTTKGRYRIIYWDMVPLVSDWIPTNESREVDRLFEAD